MVDVRPRLGEPGPRPVVGGVAGDLLRALGAARARSASTIKTKTLVIGHPRDPVHPFSDSDMLVRELPNGAAGGGQLGARAAAHARAADRRDRGLRRRLLGTARGAPRTTAGRRSSGSAATTGTAGRTRGVGPTLAEPLVGLRVADELVRVERRDCVREAALEVVERVAGPHAAAEVERQAALARQLDHRRQRGLEGRVLEQLVRRAAEEVVQVAVALDHDRPRRAPAVRRAREQELRPLAGEHALEVVVA